MSAPGKSVPWYKKKNPNKNAYLSKGQPKEYNSSNILRLDKWIPPTPDELDLWEDAKITLEKKNDKKEYWLEFEDPVQKQNGYYSLRIEVLHTDRQGFIYTAEAETEMELVRQFYPTVQKLVAYSFSPRLLSKNKPTFSGHM